MRSEVGLEQALGDVDCDDDGDGDGDGDVDDDDDVEAKLSAMNSRLSVPHHRDSLRRHEEFVQALAGMSPKPTRSLLLQAQALLEAMRELWRTRLRLGRLHGVYDGSEPAASVGAAHLKLVNERSFAVDRQC